ncbi:MAG TPA: hypothetical protein VGG64_22945 [Pirellulales bacterium]
MSVLETQFAELAAGQGVDVCRYRFFADLVRATVNPVCHALIHFQAAYSLAYDAIKNTPKKVARLGADILEETTFGVGYSFQGSLGIVLTFDNKRLDLFESVMDEAMSAIFELAHAQTSEDVAKHGKRLGAPTVRAVYQWANDHVQYGLGADIKWVRGETLKSSLFMESKSLGRLIEVLNSTSETHSETIIVTGMFAGGEHAARHRFHFIADDGADIKGSYTTAISEDNPVQWPKRYRAHIEKTTQIYYTSDKEESASYVLLRLESVN